MVAGPTCTEWFLTGPNIFVVDVINYSGPTPHALYSDSTHSTLRSTLYCHPPFALWRAAVLSSLRGRPSTQKTLRGLSPQRAAQLLDAPARHDWLLIFRPSGMLPLHRRKGRMKSPLTSPPPHTHITSLWLLAGVHVISDMHRIERVE